MPDIPIIDSHVHLWDTMKFTYPWLSELPELASPHLPADYDAASACARIEGMVFVQCDTAPSQSLAEVRWVESLSQTEPRIRGVIPYAPLEIGEGSRHYLEELKSIPLVKGVRRLIQPEADPAFCIQPGFIQGVRMLAEYGLSFDICISHVQMANAVKMTQRCPEVSFILDHIGKPDIRRGLTEPWATELRALAKQPTVICKVSGMVTEADHSAWTKEDLKPYIDHVIECFGFDRLVYGGDWPVVNLAGGYGAWVEALDWALAGCTVDESRKLFHDNGVGVYRLEVESSGGGR